MDEGKRAEFLAQFQKSDGRPLLGFAVLGGVFGEGVDLTGESLIGAAIVSPGLPQVGPRQEQLRDYFEQTRGSGFDYAYRFPGMNKVLQAAGRVIRTPEDRGVVLLIDDRFLAPDTRRLMPPHWEQLKTVDSAQALTTEHSGNSTCQAPEICRRCARKYAFAIRCCFAEKNAKFVWSALLHLYLCVL